MFLNQNNFIKTNLLKYIEIYQNNFMKIFLKCFQNNFLKLFYYQNKFIKTILLI